jgi:hypothetical protein
VLALKTLTPKPPTIRLTLNPARTAANIRAPNADPSLRHRNRELVPLPAAGLVQGVRERLPAKVRRNAVRAIEALFSTSAPTPDPDGWARASLDWAKDRWGAGNVVAATLHADEPAAGLHLHLVFVPLRDGRLQGKKTVGNRGDLRAMQESYWQAVARFGLERGRPSSGRSHLPARRLRQVNANATEDEQARAVAQVVVLRAEVSALRRQAERLRQAQVRGAAYRPQGATVPRSAILAPVPRAQLGQGLGVPAVPRQERGLDL